MARKKTEPKTDAGAKTDLVVQTRTVLSPGYAELLESRKLARLVDAGDASSLACEISGLLRNPDEARDLGRRAAWAAREYDWDAIAERLEEIYRACAGAEMRLGAAAVCGAQL